jgi:hypothetical protein
MTGLANAFGKAVGSPTSSYIFGLWRETLLYDLPWFRVTSSDTKIKDVVTNPGVPSFSWASTSAAIDFLHGSMLDQAVKNVDVLGVSKGPGVVPGITMRGVVVNLSMLESQIPVHPFNVEEGLRDAAIWDIPREDRAVRTLCSCFGLFSRYEYKPYGSNSKGLLGGG